LIDLAVIVQNLVLNMLDHGFSVGRIHPHRSKVEDSWKLPSITKNSGAQSSRISWHY
jgi:6-phosphogluconate dehydrogenase